MSASEVEQPKVVHSANAMEEYMKKQAAKKEPAAVGTKVSQAKPAITNKVNVERSKDFSESSDKYTDEDFESMSKSASHFSGLPKAGVPKRGVEVQEGGIQEPSRVISTYTKKDNRFAQTDKSFDVNQPGRDHTGVAREFTLQRHLQDAEHLIQREKDDKADIRDEML